MAKIPYKKLPRKIIASGALVALLGLGGAARFINDMANLEGYVPEGYLDPVGIPTKCFGDTRDVVVGKEYTFEECARSLNEHAVELIIPLKKCIPDFPTLPEKTRAAFASFTYNAGPGAFCKSTVAKKVNAGDLVGACKRLGERGFYDTARGKRLPGLVKRRQYESKMCLEGLREAGLASIVDIIDDNNTLADAGGWENVCMVK